jgi:glycosyltransferase involved in cell wall biosynthesis
MPIMEPESPAPVHAAVPRAGRVSVVLPAFDVAGFVAAAVESIRTQDWDDIELIAVDDGSNDDTAEVLDRLAAGWSGPGRRMRVLRQANGGAGAARNRGIAEATGAFVALYDADDLCHPGLLRAQVAALDAAPWADLSFALYRYVDEAGRVEGVQAAPGARRLGTVDLLCDNIVHAPLMRAAALRADGPLDETLRAHIDLDLFVRLTERRPRSVAVIPEVLSDYRRRGGQITGDWRRMRENWTRVLAKLEAGGLRLSGAQRRRMRARLHLYWATLAYQGGDHPAARRLIARALRADPAAILRDGHGRVRLAACGATLLPARAHGALRRWFNERAPA